jgi:hypothetical protein
MVAADRRKFGARPRFEAALGGDLGGDGRFARPFASKSFGFRRGNNGVRPFRRAFCQCSAEAMLKEMTIGQFTMVMSTRSSMVPGWLHKLAVEVAPKCQRLALGR